ncbi:MAG: DMT family transporter [Deferribacteraceae bacterium]|jgi:drug/metabolite transporter (DMT)-like permease|nr:DMT family transporter [Deferribacteraceae bacterium]
MKSDRTKPAGYATKPAGYAAVFTNKKLVLFLVLIPCLLFGSALPIVKSGYDIFMIDSTADKMVFAGYRFGSAGLVILAFAAFVQHKNIFKLDRGDILRVLLLGLIYTTLHYGCFYLGVANTTGVKGSIINATNIFMGVIISHFIYKNDRLNTRTIIGCLIGIIGVFAVNFGGELGGFRLNGEGLLLCAMFFAASGSIYGKNVSVTLDSTIMTGWQLCAGGFLLWLIGKLAHGKLPHVTPEGLGLLAYLIALSSVAISLNAVLLKYNPVSRIMVFSFTIPVFGVFFSGIILGENIFLLKYFVALVFVCVGIWLVNSRK